MNQTLCLSIDDVFRQYYRPLCLYALHYLHDISDAEDVVQDCFAHLWQCLSEGRTVGDVKSYLYSMVRNRCLDTLRRGDGSTVALSSTDLEDSLADEEEYEECSLTEARMWTAIDALPERCREVLLLCKRDGLKYEEVAVRLGISVNTVKNQVSKALKALKEGGRKLYLFFFG